MEIEDYLRFPESGREQVPGFGTINTSTRIGNEAALVIADRKYDSTPQETGTSIIADSELGPR